MRTQRILFACLFSAIPLSADANNHLLPSGGGVETTPGADAGFVVLRQPRADHRITMTVRPISGQGGNPANWNWERTEPGGGGYAAARTIRWNATASCSEGIQWIRITGPGGTQTQTLNGTRNAISGHVNYDSFDPDALDAVCIGWGEAQSGACFQNPDEGGCETERTFDENHRAIVRGSAPIMVSGACTDGPMPDETYQPRLELVCRWDP
ncbi:hypothetical protein [Jannaschia aquimarina]|uniref:Secreted protein n=1 Tax=Jannaschia aquimarina TaxID=935700 RepID=A0A0D1D6Y0_9RHOB|nr:hypothetical protein [Jannaschia aquimarina]KIT15708.1 hypothetical protein jaqu_25850 [Jannaschia aquimarina]SNT38871.1 hypothetical protein SAMN05421775_11419 [Jannaschia aquimarina]